MPSKNPSRRKPRVPAAGYDKVCIIILTDRTYVNMLYGDTMNNTANTARLSLSPSSQLREQLFGRIGDCVRRIWAN